VTDTSQLFHLGRSCHRLAGACRPRASHGQQHSGHTARPSQPSCWMLKVLDWTWRLLRIKHSHRSSVVGWHWKVQVNLVCTLGADLVLCLVDFSWIGSKPLIRTWCLKSLSFVFLLFRLSKKKLDGCELRPINLKTSKAATPVSWMPSVSWT